MCDSPPVTEDPPENYSIDNSLRDVSQVVTVYCRNTTVAVLRCLPDLKWNATVPACPSQQTKDNTSEMLIIVWVVGAVLLVALIILIVIIIRTRSKNGCRSRSPTSSPTSIFHISNHRREGGDNPAFSRADERCGEWSFHRAADLRDSARLPTYQEAILNHYISVPARAGNLNPERTNFIRANAPPSYRTSEQQGQSIAVNSIENRTVPATSQNVPATSQNVPSLNDTENQNMPESTTYNQSVERSVTNNVPADTTLSSTNRYAENYPQCFFKEEPPPPYTSGPSNYNLYRSPARHSHPQRGGFNRRNIYRRPRSRSRSPAIQDFVQNPSAHSTAVSAPPPPNNLPQNSVDYSNATNQRLNEPNATPNVFNVSGFNDRICTSNIPNTNHDSGVFTSRESSAAGLVTNTVSRKGEVVSQQCQNSTRSLRETVCHQMADHNNHSRQTEPLYVVRNSKASSGNYNFYPAQSSLLLPTNQYSMQSQPIGTSTPINQSPAVTRRFVPDNHVSPLPIPRHFHPQSGCDTHQEQYIFYTGSTLGNGFTLQKTLPHQVHIRDTSAPLAR
ncbi:hypothetical protein Btru_022571 [Bulinus truncatus]|nr:hypothetical protein Btru_022571 [Bulinus truncatus]